MPGAVASPAAVTTARPARRSADRRTRPGPLATVVVACLGILVAYIPIAGMSVVLGAIAADTHAETPDLQWITAGYVLAMAAAVLSAGVIGDVYGRKRVMILGFALMTAGSVVGLFAGLLDGPSSVHLLWASQAIMGLGGGALLTSTLGFVSQASTDQHQRTRYMALWASSLIIGAGIGPFITGWVLAVTSWGWIFVPIGILSLVMIPLTAAAVTESAPVAGRGLDLSGQVTGVVAVTALVYGIIEGGASGWGTLPNLLGLGIGAVMIAAFVLVERRAASPLVRLDVFRSVGFSVSALSALVALFTVVGSAFVLSLFFSGVQHLTVLEIAERTAFLFAMSAVFGPLAAQMQKKVAARIPLLIGLVVATAGIASFTGITSSSSLLDVGWRLALAGAGAGMLLSTVTAVAIHSVPHHLAGMAGATNTLFRQIGGALGPAVLGTIVAAKVASGGDLADALHASAIVISVALGATAVLAAVALFLPARSVKTD